MNIVSAREGVGSISWSIMPVNFGAVKYLSRVLFRNLISTKDDFRKLPISAFLPKVATRYSTVVPKQFIDVFDLLTDILFVNHTNNLAQSLPVNAIDRVQQNNVEVHRIDKLIANLDISNMQTTVKLLINELHTNIKVKDWSGVDRILKFLVDKNVLLNQPTMIDLAKEFSHAGFASGLQSLLLLNGVSESSHSVRGGILYYLAECTWKTGNVEECLATLEKFSEQHPDQISSMRKLLRIIIYQAVSNRGEAVLFKVTSFVEEYTGKYRDYYPIVILWNDLFLSEWYSDNQLADTLLTKYKNLRTSVALLASSLTQNLIQQKRCESVYRLLETLLKHEMKQPYASVTRMLYDYYCLQGDKFRCSEIIRSSIALEIPLREEQYNSFISWSVSGNPYKFIKHS